MNRPTQAVILCGGLGTRLRPLTDSMPKPLVPASGRPFLAHLVDQMHDAGIERIVLLTGYRGEMIRDYFGDGSRFGVRIDYSHGPAEWETARRLTEAKPLLDARFVLMYSDNYVPFNLDKVLERHTPDRVITLLLQRKERGNIRLDAEGRIERYDPTRSEAGLDYVEIGYMVVERDAMFASMDDPDASFSRVLVKLANAGRLGGLVSGDPYQSISDPDRWQRAGRYLESKRILLIDRDGTINERPPRGEYITRWEDFRWIPETVQGMEQLASHGFRFIVISNQAGIARGMLDAETVEAMNARMVRELGARGVEILDVYVCPHHWDENCTCRKPAPGLFFRASREHLVRLDRTVYVGDDPRDCRAAYNAECPCVLVGNERHADPGGGARPAYVAETLLDAVPWILDRFERWELQQAPDAVTLTSVAACPER